MENDKKYESVYSKKVRAGKRRTYFFDVRQTKGEDYYITLTESTKKFNSDGYERHKIFLYKEDFNRFLTGLQDAVEHVKTDLLPDYDYDEYTRRQEEWEKSQEEARKLEASQEVSSQVEPSKKEPTVEEPTQEESTKEEATTESASDEVESEEDISW